MVTTSDDTQCKCSCHGQSNYNRCCDMDGGCRHLHRSTTTAGNIGPCVYPHCRDLDGNPRLTSDVICENCRRRYRRILDRLAWNYVAIRDQLPKPQANPDDRPGKITAREYGHPAEYASDLARKIADQLNEIHDDLAEHRGDDPPPHPGVREAGRVQAAHHYLTSWLPELCSWDAAADTAEALVDLEREARRLLGQTNPMKQLHVPCPECDMLTMVRHLALTGEDNVECRNCGYTVPEKHFGLWARMVLDDMLGAAI